MPELSIHDNVLASYEVDADRKLIVLRTRSEDRQPPEYTDILFEGVLAYHFQHDSLGTILFGVEELASAEIVNSSRSLFADGKRWGWPGPWNESPEASIRYLEGQRAKGFSLSSSIGLSGWVIAQSCTLRPGLAPRAA